MSAQPKSSQYANVYDDECELYRDTCHKFYAKEVEPYYKLWEKDGKGTPVELWKKAGAAGLLGAAIPPEYGGPGGDFRYNIILNEELGKFVGGASVGAAITTDVMTNLLVEHGTHEQKLQWCPGILAGEVIQCLGLTEPSGGSDVNAIQARARKDGDHYVLSGNKCYMSSGSKANLIYFVAKTDDDLQRGKGAMTCFLVDVKNSPGISLRRMDTIGMRASGVGEGFFENVRVHKNTMIGPEGGALPTLLKGTFTLDRTIIATRALAVAQLAFDMTLAYVKTRKVFGQTVWDFQNTQFKMAEMKTDLVVGAAFRDQLLRQLADGTLDVLTATTAKLWFSEMEYRVADTCLQLHGGYGYMDDSAISRIYTWARVEKIYGGTSEIQKFNIAKSLR
jgi:alkylation response protein AidB-like acyl-CoA dehydrogenase